jgi:hypothetical protein
MSQVCVPSWITRTTRVIASATFLLIIATGCTEPRHVDHITIRNGSPYSLTVSVADRGRDGYLGLGVVPREGEQTFTEVLDQGDLWVFRFTYGGEEAAELPVTRAVLQRNRWTVEVPQEVSSTLAGLGFAGSA